MVAVPNSKKNMCFPHGTVHLGWIWKPGTESPCRFCWRMYDIQRWTFWPTALPVVMDLHWFEHGVSVGPGFSSRMWWLDGKLNSCFVALEGSVTSWLIPVQSYSAGLIGIMLLLLELTRYGSIVYIIWTYSYLFCMGNFFPHVRFHKRLY